MCNPYFMIAFPIVVYLCWVLIAPAYFSGLLVVSTMWIVYIFAISFVIIKCIIFNEQQSDFDDIDYNVPISEIFKIPKFFKYLNPIYIIDTVFDFIVNLIYGK